MGRGLFASIFVQDYEPQVTLGCVPLVYAKLPRGLDIRGAPLRFSSRQHKFESCESRKDTKWTSKGILGSTFNYTKKIPLRVKSRRDNILKDSTFNLPSLREDISKSPLMAT